MTRSMIAILVLTLCACVPSSREQPTAQQPTTASSNDDCDLVRVTVNTDLEKLVKEFIRRDNAGDFLRASAWLDSAYLCPGNLPGPDEFSVVSRTEIVSVTRADSLARVVLRNFYVGHMTQDSLGLVFTPAPRAVVASFDVVLTPYGWRIDLPDQPDRVLVTAVLDQPERFPLRPEYREKLMGFLPGAARSGVTPAPSH